LYPGRQVFRVG